MLLEQSPREIYNNIQTFFTRNYVPADQSLQAMERYGYLYEITTHS